MWWAGITTSPLERDSGHDHHATRCGSPACWKAPAKQTEQLQDQEAHRLKAGTWPVPQGQEPPSDLDQPCTDRHVGTAQTAGANTARLKDLATSSGGRHYAGGGSVSVRPAHSLG